MLLPLTTTTLATVTPAPLKFTMDPATKLLPVRVTGTFAPCAPLVGLIIVSVGGGGRLTVKVRLTGGEVCDPDDPALESFTVTIMGPTGPDDVGVPDTTPVLAFKESPTAGSPVALHVSVPAPPVAVRVKEYMIPTVAGAAVTCACVVETAGGAVSVMMMVTDFEGSAIEVAIRWSTSVAATTAGALYVTEFFVTLVRLPKL
jgi:hypothetical protein